MFLRDLVLSVQYEDAAPEQQHDLLRFQRHTHCVTDFFLECLKRRLATDGVCKLVVELHRDIREPAASECKGIDIVRFPWPLRLSGYFDKGTFEKKRVILDIIRDSLVWVCTIRKWDKHAIEVACQEALRRGLCHSGFWKSGKTWFSPNRQIGMKLFYDFELEAFRMSCVFYGRQKQELGRKLIVDEVAADAPFLYYWEDVKWISNRSVVLRSKDGRVFKCRVKELETGK